MTPPSPRQSPLAQQPFQPLNTELDLLQELLADKRSTNTRRAYERDLIDFFQCVAGAAPSPVIVESFLQLSRFNAIALVLKYKASLIDKGLKEATVNRRLAAIKALVNHARKLGLVDWTLADVKSEKIKPYRDTTGIPPESFKGVLAIPERDTLKGKRDYALLRLLWDNALRRGEISKASVRDFDPEAKTLIIYGKGRGTQAETISLSAPTVQALQDWLAARGSVKPSQPLFIALDRASYGHRLSGTSIYKIVQTSAKAAGITKQMSPHRIRHSGITAALDATGGDVRKVQKLSRHANLNTLMMYDDNRANAQGEVSNLLATLV